MTKLSIALTELAKKGADVDVLREMLQFVTQRMMDLDVEGLCGAPYGERRVPRENPRNGYRDRLWETRAGSVVRVIASAVVWRSHGRNIV